MKTPKQLLIVAGAVLLPLVSGCAATYFAAHSYVWWTGTGASAGLLRVMAGIVPLLGVMALLAFTWVTDRLPSRLHPVPVLAILLAGAAVWQPFLFYKLPPPLPPSCRSMVTAAAWLRDTGYVQARVLCYDPYLLYLLGRDPVDHARGQQIWYEHNPPAQMMNVGDILAWDSHLGRTEGHITLDQLRADPRLRPLAAFYPRLDTSPDRDRYHAVWLFLRVPPDPAGDMASGPPAAQPGRTAEPADTAEAHPTSTKIP